MTSTRWSPTTGPPTRWMGGSQVPCAKARATVSRPWARRHRAPRWKSGEIDPVARCPVGLRDVREPDMLAAHARGLDCPHRAFRRGWLPC